VRLEPGDRLLEIGCAPGKWLIYFHKRFGCSVAGCEYSERGLGILKRNLEAASTPAQIYPGDFLKLALEPASYDAVVSLGFIEHFNDPIDIARRHADLLRPGGLLILEVPNFQGINHWFQTDSLLSAHNLETMTPAFFEKVAKTLGLRVRFLKYIGGFEPANLDTRGKPFPIRALYGGLARLRLLPGMARLNNAAWSGFLMAIFEKPGPASHFQE
jgi:SAM-dependent methyltransferase